MTATKTEKPILFSTEMVQAILDGRKSQTRRIIKGLNEYDKSYLGGCETYKYPIDIDKLGVKSPYGEPGNELWVRETFAFLKEHDNKPPSEIYDNQVLYKAGGKITNRFGLGTNIHESDFGRWRPSIHMPRRYSRIQLTVTDIRVERVQEITYQDILAEGLHEEGFTSNTYNDPENLEAGMRNRFRRLWDSINADRGYSWESNPWVWVVEFEVKNIKGA